jgi:hypothetical protein
MLSEMEAAIKGRRDDRLRIELLFTVRGTLIWGIGQRFIGQSRAFVAIEQRRTRR